MKENNFKNAGNMNHFFSVDECTSKRILSMKHFASKSMFFQILTKALPEEVYESNDLFDDIHAKFTACHTLLLKR